MQSSTSLFVAALLLLAGAAANQSQGAEPQVVGLTAITIPDPEGLRPLEVHILYPAEPGGTASTIGGNRAVQGFEAVAEAPPAAGSFPLVLISHGLYGKWSNYGWLARELVAAGMIVAAPTHPGTAWTNKGSTETAKLWERPRDLSRVIDRLLDDPAWSSRIDAGRIAALGHSLGGYTVMAAAGARFDSTRYAAYCLAHPDRGDCHWYRAASVGGSAAEVAALERPLGDPRLAAVVSYDLGFTQAFDPASLAAIDIPVLVIGAGAHLPDLPVAAESRRLAAVLPEAGRQYHEIADISHFSIFPLCQPGAVELLKAADEGDEVICGDGGGRDRATLHGVLRDLIVNFLRASGFGAASAG